MAQQHTPSVIVHAVPQRTAKPARAQGRHEARPKVRAELRAWAQRMQAHARKRRGHAQGQPQLWPTGRGRGREDTDTGGG